MRLDPACHARDDMERTHAVDQVETATMLPTKRRLYLVRIEHMPRTAKPFVCMLRA